MLECQRARPDVTLAGRPIADTARPSHTACPNIRPTQRASFPVKYEVLAGHGDLGPRTGEGPPYGTGQDVKVVLRRGRGGEGRGVADRDGDGGFREGACLTSVKCFNERARGHPGPGPGLFSCAVSCTP